MLFLSSRNSPGDVLLVTKLDRLARSTRDLLDTLAAIARVLNLKGRRLSSD
jgi:DNA invertase Pin-like site-specific DNA recombinase